MPKVAEVKVGTRNRERTATQVEFLIDGEPSNNGEFWDLLLDQDGDFYGPMVQKGLVLEEGTDYRILDSDGKEQTLKSAPEKVRSLILVEVAERLNVPTTVKVPETGSHIAANSRNWVGFRPRMDTPFEDDAARNEYIAKQQ